MQTYDLTALRKESTCFQSQNPNCINQFLTNQKTFTHCQTFETGLSDLRKLILTIVKSCIFKGQTKKNIDQFYKKFDNKCFSNALREQLKTLAGDKYGEFEQKLLF